MSREELVQLASRALALLTTMWLVLDVMYLPEKVMALFFHWGPRCTVAT